VTDKAADQNRKWYFAIVQKYDVGVGDVSTTYFKSKKTKSRVTWIAGTYNQWSTYLWMQRQCLIALITVTRRYWTRSIYTYISWLQPWWWRYMYIYYVSKYCGDITDIGSRTTICDINVNTSLITIIISTTEQLQGDRPAFASPAKTRDFDVMRRSVIVNLTGRRYS
jgi:hypothetical protein